VVQIRLTDVIEEELITEYPFLTAKGALGDNRLVVSLVRGGLLARGELNGLRASITAWYLGLRSGRSGFDEDAGDADTDSAGGVSIAVKERRKGGEGE